MHNTLSGTPWGEETHARFDTFSFRKNPSEAPLAKAFLQYGYAVRDYPIYSQYTHTDWLASEVVFGKLSIAFRQPTPSDLWIVSIKRIEKSPVMRSALLGIVEFYSFLHQTCPEITIVGGTLSKTTDALQDNELPMERLFSFYQRLLGDIEVYKKDSSVSIYAHVHNSERFEKFPIWKRYARSALVQGNEWVKRKK